MKDNSIEKSSLFLINNIRLKKKSDYLKKLSSYILELDNFLVEKQKYKRLYFFLKKKPSLLKKGVFVGYSICFSFSTLNTFLYLIDSLGNLKFSSSAGSLGFKGKAKKNRFQVLKLFFRGLRELRLNFLKTHPVSVHLNNVSSYRRLIIRNLKKTLFVKVVKNYQTYSYNGCRKKKKLRK
jgi:ribosomal protein S11